MMANVVFHQMGMELQEYLIQDAENLKTILVYSAPLGFTSTKMEFVKLLTIFAKHGATKMETVSPAIEVIL